MEGFAERRSRTSGRDKSVRIALTDAEMAELATAAAREGLARGAFTANAALAAARGEVGVTAAYLRVALAELTRSADLVHRLGRNLNEAVRVLHASGEPTDELGEAAAECDRMVRNLDKAAELVRRRLP